ncbi:ribonuclease P protein component [Novispirillum itersonii]|uniref:ribonuclease P protein component n=1 Tax=Novispirillum itersonii TaxID=189 RepID=UPI0003A5839B|nr:ribonuclease P protein component [Novispirillum itersonii]
MSATPIPMDLCRLKQRRDFLRVAAERRKWVTPGLILQAASTPLSARTERQTALSALPLPSSEMVDVSSGLPDGTIQASARVGFTVSKKVGNSVARNRARRRLRAAVDAVMPLLAQDGMDYVLIGRPATIDRPWDALLKDLRTALTRIRTVEAGSDPLPPRRKGGKPGKGQQTHFGRGKGPAPRDTAPVSTGDDRT